MCPPAGLVTPERDKRHASVHHVIPHFPHVPNSTSFVILAKDEGCLIDQGHPTEAGSQQVSVSVYNYAKLPLIMSRWSAATVVLEVYYVLQRGNNEDIFPIVITHLDVPHVSHHIEIGPQIPRVR